MKVATGMQHAQAGELIRKLRDNGTLPNYLGGGADALSKLLHLVPAARGQQSSAHGLGERALEADERLARLALTTSAAFIVFVADRPANGSR